jgi:hypothetical protein
LRCARGKCVAETAKLFAENGSVFAISDHRLSMLGRFAKAMEIPLEELLAEDKKSRSKVTG